MAYEEVVARFGESIIIMGSGMGMVRRAGGLIEEWMVRCEMVRPVAGTWALMMTATLTIAERSSCVG